MKISRFFSLAILLLLAAANASTIAVLEIVLASDDGMDLTVEETKFLTDELRRQAAMILPKEYSVLTREEIISLASKSTENLNTVIEIGRAIKSDYVTRGSIGKLGSLFTLTVEIYEVSNGKLLNYFSKETADLKGLLDAIRENSPNLFAKAAQKEEPIKVSEPQPATPTDIPTNIPTNIPANTPTESQKIKTSFWVALGLDVLGATALGLGIYNNAKSSKSSDESKRLYNAEPKDEDEYKKNKKAYDDEQDKMKSAEKARNIFYATGGALLVGGIAVHIWF